MKQESTVTEGNHVTSPTEHKLLNQGTHIRTYLQCSRLMNDGTHWTDDNSLFSELGIQYNDNLKNYVLHLQEQVDLNAKESALAGELGKALLENNNQLKQEIKELHNQLLSKDKDVEKSTKTCKRQEEEIQELKLRKSKTDSQLKELHELTSRLFKDISRLEQQNSSLKLQSKEVEAINKRLRDTKAQVDERDRMVEELKNVEQDLRKKNKHLENVIAKLEVEVSFLKTDNEAIYKQLDRKDEIANTSIGEIRSYLATIKDLQSENMKLKDELENTKDELVSKVSKLGDQSLRLQEQQEALRHTREELQQLKDHVKQKVEQKNVHTTEARTKSSLLDELLQLEEKVVIRVQEELKASDHVQPKDDSTNSATLSLPKTSFLDVDNFGSNTPWMNFMSYLSWLKSPSTTREYVHKMPHSQLVELAGVLSRVVNAYSTRLIEVLQEREEIKTEREFRVSVLQQLLSSQQESTKPETNLAQMSIERQEGRRRASSFGFFRKKG